MTKLTLGYRRARSFQQGGPMLIRNNRGELIGEINTIVHEGVVLTSNTVYSQDGERVVTQTITSRDSAGTVRTETFYGGKLLP